MNQPITEKHLWIFLIMLILLVGCGTSITSTPSETAELAIDLDPTEYSTEGLTITIHRAYWLATQSEPTPTIDKDSDTAESLPSGYLVIEMTVTNRRKQSVEFNCALIDVTHQRWYARSPLQFGIDREDLLSCRSCPGKAEMARRIMGK